MIKKHILLSSFLAVILTGCGHGIGMVPLNNDYNLNGVNSNFKKFILDHSYRLDQTSVNNIAKNVSYYSRLNSVDPKLVLAVIARESSFRSEVVSSAGAIGLGQLMTPTAKDMGVTDPFNPEENIKGTTKYLSWLLKRSKGDTDRVLASYNMGPGAVDIYIKAGKTLPSGVRKYVSDVKYFFTKV